MNNFNVKEIGSDGINERNVESAIFFFLFTKKKNRHVDVPFP